MAVFIKDRVIVLKKHPFQEADFILRVLNPKGAVLSLIAKGAAASRRRFTGGVLDPGHFIGVEYRPSRLGHLHFLNSAWFIHRFEGIKKSYDHLSLALYFVHLIEKVSQEGVQDCQDHFNLLGGGLKALCRHPDLKSLQFLFEFRLLWMQGVLPREFQKEKELLSLTLSEHQSPVLKSPRFKNMAPVIHSLICHYAHLSPAPGGMRGPPLKPL